MSIEPKRCGDCGAICQLDRQAPFANGDETLYFVGWKCPVCQSITADVCPVGPVIPADDTCLNCGGGYPKGVTDGKCQACGFTRTAASTFLQVDSIPDDWPSVIREALDEGRFRFAVALANKAILREWESPAAWDANAAFYRSLGYEQPLKQLVDAGIGAAIVPYGDLLQKRSRTADAIGIYREWLKKYPGDESSRWVIFKLAEALMASGDSSESDRILSDRIAREPENVNHYCDYVLVLKNNRRYEEALRVASDGLKVATDDSSRIWLLETQSFFFAEQYQGAKALSSINHAIALGASGVRTRYLYGRALALQGRLQEARKEMAWVLSVDPENADAQRAIKWLDAATRPWWKIW